MNVKSLLSIAWRTAGTLIILYAVVDLLEIVGVPQVRAFIQSPISTLRAYAGV